MSIINAALVKFPKYCPLCGVVWGSEKKCSKCNCLWEPLESPRGNFAKDGLTSSFPATPSNSTSHSRDASHNASTFPVSPTNSSNGIRGLSLNTSKEHLPPRPSKLPPKPSQMRSPRTPTQTCKNITLPKAIPHSNDKSACGESCASSYDSSECWSDVSEEVARCEKCSKKILSGGVKANDVWYHSECFFCSGCAMQFSEKKKPLKVRGRLICSDCYKKNLKKCPKCGLVVKGRFVEVGDDMYHSDCFTCKRCCCIMEKRYWVLGDEILCEKCYRGK